MLRRDFHRLCTGLAAMAAAPGAVGAVAPRVEHNRVTLVDADGTGLKSRDIAERESWVFAYPFAASPCFLINLGEQAEPNAHNPYALRSRDAPNATLVAFAAICTHKLSHPAKAMSFITYRPPTDSVPHHRIVCCSEGSVYDAARGAQVLGGPAPAPLAAIELSESEDGTLHAGASYAGNLYDRFFAAFEFRLALEYQIDNPRAPVENTTVVRTLAEHSAQHIECF
ncbi:MAG: hypothetical protein AAF499_09155 [Pseudomonadota bacterium]